MSDLGRGSLFGDLNLHTRVVTPNGDGFNDDLVAELEVFVVEGEKRIEATIFDLAGRRLRDLSQRPSQPSGRHRLRWDGRAENGRLVPPGIYLLRLRLDTESSADVKRSALIHVVY